MRGKFIVLYASNNLGKSKQVEMLVDELRQMGKEVVQLKYPIYESTTGRVINNILRHGEVASDEQLQELFALNRRHYEVELVRTLEEGKWVVAEDYVGTGLAWGLTKGVDRGFLDEINYGLLEPDLAILLDAENRFTCGIEKGHRHEAAGDEVWRRNREIHLELATEFDWKKIRADMSPEVVHYSVMNTLRSEGLLYPRPMEIGRDWGDDWDGHPRSENMGVVDDGWI